MAAAKAGPSALVMHPDIGGQYARSVLMKTLAYTASLVPEIADTIYDVDEAMKDGYAWDLGPFETLDKMGPKWFAEQLTAANIKVPPLLKLRLKPQVYFWSQ